MTELSHVWRFVARTPWAILPEKLDEILAFLQLHESGVRFTAEELQARIGDPPRRQTQVASRTGIIPVYGTIVPRAGMMTDLSGAVAAEQLAREVRAFAADPGVDRIVLDINSPGGNVVGLPELAAEIRAARDVKPVIAVANPMAASAAYHIAAQASEIAVTPSGAVGSIGVFAMHEDISRAIEGQGRKVTMISAGKFKTEGNPFEPLTDEARATIQDNVDVAYNRFVADVAKGRGVSEDLVRAGFGEGRMVHAERAVEQRMADRIETFDQVIARLASGSPAVATGTRFAAAAGADAALTHDAAGQAPANVAAMFRLIEHETRH
jgi:signal peptide peptidase SppA